MNDEGMQNQDDQNNEEMPNILVGRVQLVERHVPELFRDTPPKAFSDPSGLWGKYFAPDKGMTPICMQVPPEWANFFTAALLSPKTFS
jgi:hypothetical protein